MSSPQPTNRMQRRHPDAHRHHFIRIAEAAEYLGVTERTIRQMVTDGRLRAYRLGAHTIRLDLTEINDAMLPFGGAV